MHLTENRLRSSVAPPTEIPWISCDPAGMVVYGNRLVAIISHVREVESESRSDIAYMARRPADV